MTLYPGELDAFSNPDASDPTNSPSHSAQHGAANDAIEAIEAKVGIGASTPVAGKVLTGTDDGESSWENPAASGAAGGQLGGTYPNPTVNASHSGSTHAATQAAAEATAAASLSAHNGSDSAHVGVPRLYRTAIAYNTPNLTAGVTVYTPAMDEWLLNAWVEVVEAWDGTSPLGNLGTFSGGDEQGIWNNDDTPGGAGLDMTALHMPNATGSTLLQAGVLKNTDAVGVQAYMVSSNGDPGIVPARFTTTDPLQFIVTQDSLPGGAEPGATQGSGFVYVLVATPVAP